jgi:hypothetical protein
MLRCSEQRFWYLVRLTPLTAGPEERPEHVSGQQYTYCCEKARDIVCYNNDSSLPVDDPSLFMAEWPIGGHMVTEVHSHRQFSHLETLPLRSISCLSSGSGDGATSGLVSHIVGCYANRLSPSTKGVTLQGSIALSLSPFVYLAETATKKSPPEFCYVLAAFSSCLFHPGVHVQLNAFPVFYTTKKKDERRATDL